jgi:CopG family transcriptional regulator, nickel-responsive regulator
MRRRRLRRLRPALATEETDVGTLARFSVAMDEDLLARFDDLVARRGSGDNRSEAVRDLVRDALVDAEWEDSAGEIVGTVTMVFDHHASDLSDKLDALQHAHHERIVSSMHVHLDAHNCLEVIVVRGTSAQVRAIAEGLLGTKGVKHGKLVSTTTGRHL